MIIPCENVCVQVSTDDHWLERLVYNAKSTGSSLVRDTDSIPYIG